MRPPIHSLACTTFVLLCVMTSTVANAQEDRFVRMGLYVVVSDIDRATDFYEKLFEKKPYVANESFVGFEIAGGLYGLFAESAYTPTLSRGNNTVPYVRVSDIEKEHARLRKLAPKTVQPEIVTEGPLRLFVFEDPDGNVVEFYSVTLPPASASGAPPLEAVHPPAS